MCLFIGYENGNNSQIIIQHESDLRDYLESKNVSNDVINHIENIHEELKETAQECSDLERELEEVKEDCEQDLANKDSEYNNLSEDFSQFIHDITDKIIEIGISNSIKIQLLEYILECQNHDKFYTERELRCLKTEIELRNSNDIAAKAFAKELPF